MKQTLLTEIKPLLGTCFKCGSTRNVIKHHTSYNPEIIVDCCRSCHNRIHQRIRRKGLCPLSVKETARVSTRSSVKRTQKNISFSENIVPNVRLFENIVFSTTTGNVYYSSMFSANHGKKIYYLKE